MKIMELKLEKKIQLKIKAEQLNKNKTFNMLEAQVVDRSYIIYFCSPC